MSVNLTSQLVLTTIFISVSGSLPKTAYLKMIDVWLIFAQLIPFVEVIILTFLELYNEEDDVINHHGFERKVGSPSPSPIQVNIKYL